VTQDEAAIFTIPGRWGDIIYALPVIEAFAHLTGRMQHLIVSPQARFLSRLLRNQPYVSSLTTAHDYVPQSGGFGLQPFQVPVPEGAVGRVFHLGLRPQLNAQTVFSQPLPETFRQNLIAEGGPDLELALDRAWLVTDPHPTNGLRMVRVKHGRDSREVMLPEIYVVCQPWGTSTLQFYLAPTDKNGRPDTGLLFDQLLAGGPDRSTVTRKDVWTHVLNQIKHPLIVVGSRDDLATARKIIPQATLLEPVSGLELAKLIAGAAAFIGAESIGAALAAGLKLPGVLDEVFGNTLPDHLNSLMVRRLARPRPPSSVRGKQDIDPDALADVIRHLHQLDLI
jgi:hypothetical protein